ncbi:MAG: hypothetical protein L5655_00495 [Thermosediminibacteraceae bacterium]|nr:hypothetical protein [Thermosediminibacteraceae bacterium]
MIIGTGPLHPVLYRKPLAELLGREYLYFYDAAPVITPDSIERNITNFGILPPLRKKLMLTN